MDRREFIGTIAGCLLAVPLAASAQQQPVKVFRIGFLGAESAIAFGSRVEAFRAGLRDFGYEEGKNIAIEYRWADGKYDRLPDLAAELVGLKVDVLVAGGEKASVAAKSATSTTPIIATNAGDAVAAGLIAGLAQPSGNITGISIFGSEVMAKRLELLKEAMPGIRQVAVLMNAESPAMLEPILQAMRLRAAALKMGIQLFEVRAPSEFESAFSAMAKDHVDAVVISGDTLFIFNARRVADAAAKQRLPSVGQNPLAEAGCLIGFGPSLIEGYRRAGYFLDKILKGARPGDLPVEQPTKFELVINLKTAKALGITIPHSLLLRADEVIQ
jgi:putative ABC transport system substrate-binding protein